MSENESKTEPKVEKKRPEVFKVGFLGGKSGPPVLFKGPAADPTSSTVVPLGSTTNLQKIAEALNLAGAGASVLSEQEVQRKREERGEKRAAAKEADRKARAGKK